VEGLREGVAVAVPVLVDGHGRVPLGAWNAKAVGVVDVYHVADIVLRHGGHLLDGNALAARAVVALHDDRRIALESAVAAGAVIGIVGWGEAVGWSRRGRRRLVPAAPVVVIVVAVVAAAGTRVHRIADGSADDEAGRAGVAAVRARVAAGRPRVGARVGA